MTMEVKHESGSQSVEKVAASLQKDFVVITKTRIKPWQAWLIVGLVAGVAVGAVLASNKKGEVAEGEAAGKLGNQSQLDAIVY